ncbi:hypothetical protein [Halobacteriovorax sp. RT-2-2]|uniref:hypothetical protein n=2 Tax=unclassified Halobacteriovorax TaxID=2639665 RepID=UPI0039A5FE64
MNKLIKINHVLQFIVYILFIIFLSFMIYSSLTASRSNTANQVDLNKGKSNEKLGQYVSVPVTASNDKYLVSYVVNFDKDRNSYKSFKSSGSNEKYTSFLSSDLWGCYRCSISNLKIINRNTSKSKDLFDAREVIGGFAIPRNKDRDGEPTKNKLDRIFFSKVDADFNSDKILSSKDGYRLFISDFDGKSKVALSPEGTDVISYRVDYEFKKIYIQVKKDSNNNFKFDDGDDVVVLDVSLREYFES